MNRPGNDIFVTTRWTMVLQASHSDPNRARMALEDLCQAYWYPLYSYVRRRGYSAHDAEDLTQGYFVSLFKLNSLGTVSPERGKFRAFLLASMKNYLLVEWNHAFAQKRDIRQTIPLDLDAAETRYHREPTSHIPPEIAFDRQWAFTLLERVIHRLHREYKDMGRAALFRELRHAITLGEDLVPGAELASRLDMSEEAIRVAVHRLRKRYRQLLHDEIAETIADASEVEAEMAYLRQVVSASAE